MVRSIAPALWAGGGGVQSRQGAGRGAQGAQGVAHPDD